MKVEKSDKLPLELIRKRTFKKETICKFVSFYPRVKKNCTKKWAMNSIKPNTQPKIDQSIAFLSQFSSQVNTAQKWRRKLLEMQEAPFMQAQESFLLSARRR